MEEIFRNKDLNNLAKHFGVSDVAKEIFANSNISSNHPRYQLLDIGEEYQYRFELPGVPKNNINLTRKGYSLIIEGYHPVIGKFVKDELRYPEKFYRKIPLEGDCDKIKSAKFENGFLIITISKVHNDEKVEII